MILNKTSGEYDFEQSWLVVFSILVMNFQSCFQPLVITNHDFNRWGCWVSFVAVGPKNPATPRCICVCSTGIRRSQRYEDRPNWWVLLLEFQPLVNWHGDETMKNVCPRFRVVDSQHLYVKDRQSRGAVDKMLIKDDAGLPCLSWSINHYWEPIYGWLTSCYIWTMIG